MHEPSLTPAVMPRGKCAGLVHDGHRIVLTTMCRTNHILADPLDHWNPLRPLIQHRANATGVVAYAPSSLRSRSGGGILIIDGEGTNPFGGRSSSTVSNDARLLFQTPIDQTSPLIWETLT